MMLSAKSGSALRMLQQQHSSLVHSRPFSRCVRAKAFSRRCNNAQVRPCGDQAPVGAGLTVPLLLVSCTTVELLLCSCKPCAAGTAGLQNMCLLVHNHPFLPAPACVCLPLMLLLQVHDSSTDTASAQPGRVAVFRQDSLPGMSCHGPLSKRQIFEKGTRIIDGALAETVKGIKQGGHDDKATRVLELLAEAYADSLKTGLSHRLQVGPHLHLLE